MKYKNSVHPTKEQMEGFLEGDNEAPIAMLNLLKLNIPHGVVTHVKCLSLGSINRR